MQDKLRQLIYVPQHQQSSIVLPPEDEEDDIAQKPFLTEADLPLFTNNNTSASSSTSCSSSTSSSSEPPETSISAEGVEAAAAAQSSPSQVISADSPQQAQHERALAQHELQTHAEAKARAQATAQGTPPYPDWGSTPIDAAPVSTLGLATAEGRAPAVDCDQPLDHPSLGQGLRPQDWQAANVVPEGLVLQPCAGEIGAPLLQTPTQLPTFALDTVLWPNQIMMLRQAPHLASSTFGSDITNASLQGLYGRPFLGSYIFASKGSNVRINVNFILVVTAISQSRLLWRDKTCLAYADSSWAGKNKPSIDEAIDNFSLTRGIRQINHMIIDFLCLW